MDYIVHFVNLISKGLKERAENRQREKKIKGCLPFSLLPPYFFPPEGNRYTIGKKQARDVYDLGTIF